VRFAVVTLRRRCGDVLGMFEPDAAPLRVDEDGGFSIPALIPEQEYQLEASAPGYRQRGQNGIHAYFRSTDGDHDVGDLKLQPVKAVPFPLVPGKEFVPFALPADNAIAALAPQKREPNQPLTPALIADRMEQA